MRINLKIGAGKKKVNKRLESLKKKTKEMLFSDLSQLSEDNIQKTFGHSFEAKNKFAFKMEDKFFDIHLKSEFCFESGEYIMIIKKFREIPEWKFIELNTSI